MLYNNVVGNKIIFGIEDGVHLRLTLFQAPSNTIRAPLAMATYELGTTRPMFPVHKKINNYRYEHKRLRQKMHLSRQNSLYALGTSVISASLDASKAPLSASRTFFNDIARVSYSSPATGQKQKFNESITKTY